ncbi:16S rRNA (cytosine(967)-C(5))-methyltransferase RsmB [uncultured Thiodictyon sp.]|uniref:16S rRNA (cytosine(967)-C(5))-methyltransferase RsmB n=1 Tax=uncultured Thiodictyon sp. TaxID=1846217 RepID=UPI0025F51D2E|nr:16S rRNA (cytosine(967)-C(5))-methyltransferase RsmB [uncultured Thiodictyon sp.]
MAERGPKDPTDRDRRATPSPNPRDASGRENPWGRAKAGAARAGPTGNAPARRERRGAPRRGDQPDTPPSPWSGPADAERQPGADARAAAALAIHQVRDRGQSLTRVMSQSVLPRPPADRALTQELIYGTLRVLPRLEALVGILLHHPVKPSDRDLEALILVGLYQLTVLGTPPHAAVAATVEAVRLLGKPDKAGLVNALLRRFLREREALLAEADALPSVRWLFPEWLLAALRRDWPEDWEAIVGASNARPPMSLRVNATRTDRRAYAGLLAADGITARPIAGTESGLMLDRPVPAQTLPGFAEGLVSVQDGGAQLAAQLLDAQPGERVLDACAAPGGKTAHILERAGPGLELVAIDSAAARLVPLRENLARLGLNARVECADAAAPRGAWDRPLFDRILLDVPCSATGVIRRHPDIKWLRRATDIAELCALQARILDAIWPLLVPGGRLLYVTCSLLAAENQDQIAAFLARQPQASERAIPIGDGRARPHGYQLLPTDAGSDGFYFALLEKLAP